MELMIIPTPEQIKALIARNEQLATVEVWGAAFMQDNAPEFEAVRTAKPMLFAEHGAENTRLAVIACKANEVDSLRGLKGGIAKQAMQYYPLRTLRTEISRMEATSDGRGSVLRAVYDAGLGDALRALAKIYLRADTAKFSEVELEALLTEATKMVRTNFAALSMEEIKAAFAAAALSGVLSYGVFDISLIARVLGDYVATRNKALAAYIGEERAARERAAAEAQRVARNAAALEVAKQEFAALAIQNSRHASFYTCPHHFVREFVAAGYIELEQADKIRVMRAARSYLAHDIISDAQTVAQRTAARDFVNALGVTPEHSPRPSVLSEYVKLLGIGSFDYTNPTREKFEAAAATYYAKMLYFEALAPYDDGTPKKPANQSPVKDNNDDANSTPPN